MRMLLNLALVALLLAHAILTEEVVDPVDDEPVFYEEEKSPPSLDVVEASDDERKDTEVVTKENPLKIEDLYKVPDSECQVRSQENDWIEWHYIGTLLDGNEFHRGMFHATLGHGHVIKGVDEGMRGLCAGDRRRMTIHSDWAYGDQGRPPTIPPKATLVFEVEVHKVKRPDEHKVEL